MTDKVNNRGEWSQEKCGTNTPPKFVPDKPIKITEGYVKKGGVNKKRENTSPRSSKGANIIIDGVDVSECKWIFNTDFEFDKHIQCIELGNKSRCRNNPNCYYKQLVRAQQELSKKTKECENIKSNLQYNLKVIKGLGKRYRELYRQFQAKK